MSQGQRLAPTQCAFGKKPGDLLHAFGCQTSGLTTRSCKAQKKDCCLWDVTTEEPGPPFSTVVDHVPFPHEMFCCDFHACRVSPAH